MQQQKYSSNDLCEIFRSFPCCNLEIWVIPKYLGTGFTSAADAKSLQSCLTLCDPIDGSPPGCPVPGILQARILEWVAISFSNAWKWKVKVKSLSRVRLLVTSWTAAYQAPPSMGFSRQEYWSGVPLPSPGFRSGPCKYYNLALKGMNLTYWLITEKKCYLLICNGNICW